VIGSRPKRTPSVSRVTRIEAVGNVDRPQASYELPTIRSEPTIVTIESLGRLCVNVTPQQFCFWSRVIRGESCQLLRDQKHGKASLRCYFAHG
jgi:hypothetical protein